jgi:tetratricopeptide (TPR) repeat protein
MLPLTMRATGLGRACASVLARTWVPPVLAGIVFHLPALFCTFVYDDVSLVAEHPRLGSTSFLGELWQRDYGLEFAGEPRGFYRPLFMAMVWLLRNLCGASPLAFHLFSLAVFSLAVYLVVRVAETFDRDGTRILPLLAGVLYAVHPARVEVVSLVMSLPDLLVECGTLGMVLLLARAAGASSPSAPRLALACGGLALAAALCKESTFFLVPAVVLTAALHAARTPGTARRIILPAAAAALAGLGAALLLRGAAHVQAPVPLTATARSLLFGGRAADTLLGLLLAARDVVVPGPVVFWRTVYAAHIPGAAFLLALAALGFCGAWLCALRRNRLLPALLVAWLGAGAANLALLFAAGYAYSQRYLAFAPVAILLCLLLRAALDLLARRVPFPACAAPGRCRTFAVLAVSAFLSAQGAFALAGSATCLTPLSFFLAMERASPADVMPVGAVAQTLNRVGTADEVEERVRRAAALDPAHPQVPRLQNMLIQRYLAERRFEDARRCAAWARGMYPADADKQALHAVALANLGRPDLARQEVEAILAKHPDHAGARQLRDQILAREGKGGTP